MSRRRPSHLVTLDGIGIAKPSTTRASAMQAKRWWARRLGVDLSKVRIKGFSA